LGDAPENSDRFYLSGSYALGYMLLSECSDEPAGIAEAVLQQWDTAGVQRQRLLDVGAADGRITSRLRDGFAHVEAYEPNGILFALLRRQLPSSMVTLHNGAWRTRYAIHQSVSHSFFSHVLYHIPISRWKTLIESAMRVEVSGRGRVATFVLWDDEAEAQQFCRRVSSDRWHVTSADLIRLLAPSTQPPNCRWCLSTMRLAPTIRIAERPAAEAVATFLLGRRHPNTLSDRNAHDELVSILIGPGLNNSQSIITISRCG